MASKTKTKSAFNLSRSAKLAEARIKELVKAQTPAAPRQQKSAVADYYLLIDFGFTAGVPFVPNSVQFYSNTSGFLCFKLVDNVSLVSLVPILNCKQVKVTWDVSTQEAIHIYGMQPK